MTINAKNCHLSLSKGSITFSLLVLLYTIYRCSCYIFQYFLCDFLSRLQLVAANITNITILQSHPSFVYIAIYSHPSFVIILRRISPKTTSHYFILFRNSDLQETRQFYIGIVWCPNENQREINPYNKYWILCVFVRLSS